MKSDALVIIPTYNEKENIAAIIQATFNQKKEFDILVVDDNSPDGTANIVAKLQKEYPNRLYIEKRTPFHLWASCLFTSSVVSIEPTVASLSNMKLSSPGHVSHSKFGIGSSSPWH